jgi:hypothetical protein
MKIDKPLNADLLSRSAGRDNPRAVQVPIPSFLISQSNAF